MYRSTSRITAIALLATIPFIASCGTEPASPDTAELTVSLHVDQWGEKDLDKYIDLGAGPAYQSALQLPVSGSKGIVTGTSGVLATHVGTETLRQGGSAMDAVIATSLMQTLLTGGSAISYAGIWTMVYYDADSGQLHSMNAGYNTVQLENDPLSISGIDIEEAIKGGNFMQVMQQIRPDGRTALVPGFMAGAQAGHDRFGKLPWATLFEPTIYFAENGIPVDAYLASVIESNKDVLSRLSETKAVFTDEDGEFLQAGDTFRQTLLAETLRNVAEHGAVYMYTGPWAKKFVEMVRADGGKMTLKDMNDYDVIWSNPIIGAYGDYQIAGYAPPALGGAQTIEALNLLKAADLRQFSDKHYESGEALYWYGKILEVPTLSYLTAEEREELYPGVDLSLEARGRKETADFIWKKLRETNGDLLRRAGDERVADESPKHSAGVVAIDQWGNIAAVVHSINTVGFGRTGIFIDGVSIPDSAWFQQKQIMKAGPGNRLPDPTNPLIVLKNGQPYLGSTSIGSDLHQQTVQGLYYVLEYGMTPNDAVSSPTFLGNGLSDAGFRAVEGEFSPEVIDKIKTLGQKFTPTPGRPRFWLAVTIDPETGSLHSSDATLLAEDGSVRPMGLSQAH